MNPSNQKRRLFVLIAVGLVLIVALIVGLTSDKKSPQTSFNDNKAVDTDTGETVLKDSGRTPETDSPQLLSLMGSDQIYNTMTSNQFQTLRGVLHDYILQNVGQSVTTAKFLPETFKDNFTTVESQVKIDNPETLLHLTVDVTWPEVIGVTIQNLTNPNVPVYSRAEIRADSVGDIQDHLEEDEDPGHGDPPN